MGAIIEKVQSQPQMSLLSTLQSQQSKQIRPTIIAVKFPQQHLERILDLINNNPIKGLTIINSVLQYHRVRYSAQLRKQPIQNIVAIRPTAWKGWDNIANEIYTHSRSKIYLFDNSLEAYYCADKEMVLDERGEIIAERNTGCFC